MSDRLNSKRRWVYLLPVVMAATGVGMVLFQTRFGPGASGDSAFYLMGAKNWLAGNGYSRFSGGYELKPITGFPPGFSFAVALASIIIPDPLQAARWMNAFLFGANLMLVFALIWRHSESWAAGLVGQGLLLVSPTQFQLHSWVMSEPLFIFLLLSSLILLDTYLRKSRRRLLLAAAALIAAATLTRYVGISLMVAGVVAVALFGKASLRRRVEDLAILVTVTGLPMILWLRRNASVADTLTNRELIYHPMRPDLIRLYLAELSSWVMPHELPLPTPVRAALAMLIVFGLAGLLVFLALRGKWVSWLAREARFASNRPVIPFLVASASTGCAYLGVLVANSLFLDAATTASAPPRYLAPVYVLMVVVLVVVGSLAHERIPHRGLIAGMVVVVAITGFAQAESTIQMLRDPLPHLGYLGRRYTWPDVTAALDDVDPSVPIVSNNPEMVYILSGRPAYVRPIRFDVYQQQARQDYLDQVQATKERLDAGGVLVIFGEPEAVDHDILKRTGAHLSAKYSNAAFYVCQNCGG